jgi:hypothetical protein
VAAAVTTESHRDTDPAPPPRTDLSLGERCVEWCIRQMQGQLRPSTALLASWFEIAERNGRPLGLRVTETNRPNHCAIAQCNAAFECRIPGELIPHRMRAAAKELMVDAIGSRAWHSRAEVDQGWRPRTGDLAIYDRSKPGKPETSWYGHVDRVIECTGGLFKNIGANEGPRGEWVLQVTPIDTPKLLGFVSYPTLEPVQRETSLEITDEDRAHVASLVGLSLSEAEARWWEETQQRRSV